MPIVKQLFVTLSALILFSIHPGVSVHAGQLETIPVGVCLSFTGDFAPYGKINLAGMRLFVDDFNSRAGEHGFKLDLIVMDDESVPARAAEIVDEFVDAHGVGVIAGGVTSDIMMAMIERAKEREVVLVSPAATSPKIGNRDDWAFKVLPSDDSQGRALAKFFASQMGCATAAVAVNDFFVYGNEIASTFKTTFEGLGGEILAEEHYVWDTSASERFDFTKIIDRLHKAAPEVTLLAGYPNEAVELIRQAEKLDWRTIFCGGDSWLNMEIIYKAGERLHDSYYVGGAEIYSSAPEAKRFVELMDQSTDKDLETYSVNGYDVMTLLTDAFKSGARTARQIRARLQGLRNFPLVAGKLSFDVDQNTGKTLYIYRIGQMTDGFYSEVVAEVQPD